MKTNFKNRNKLVNKSETREQDFLSEFDELFEDGGTPEVVGRRGVRQNPDGSVSTHLMAREYVPDRGWVAFPTLFQNSAPLADDSGNWVEMDTSKGWGEAYEEAVRRGEVYDFGEDEEAAINFADKGNWKKFEDGGKSDPPPNDIIYTDNPMDTRLAMYNDSLNLYNAYQTQLNYLGEKPFPDWMTNRATPETFGTSGMIVETPVEDVDEYVRKTKEIDSLIKSGMSVDDAYDMYPGLGNSVFKNPRDYYKAQEGTTDYSDDYDVSFLEVARKNRDLGEVYDSLRFAYPTRTGYYTSADLVHERIKPTDIWYDGYAQNPRYKKPTQEVVYTGAEELPYSQPYVPGVREFNSGVSSKSDPTRNAIVPMKSRELSELPVNRNNELAELPEGNEGEVVDNSLFINSRAGEVTEEGAYWVLDPITKKQKLVRGSEQEGTYGYRNFEDGGTAEFDKLLNIMSEQRGLAIDSMRNVVNKIGYHESDKTMNPKMKQYGSGIGRGIFQFEPDSLKTTINRAKNFYKAIGQKVPEFITKIKDYDATKLSADQQKALALIDMSQRPNFSLANAIKDDESLAKEWGRGWQTESDPKKIKLFLEHASMYDKKQAEENKATPAIVEGMLDVPTLAIDKSLSSKMKNGGVKGRLMKKVGEYNFLQEYNKI